jgi:hypothetical protein
MFVCMSVCLSQTNQKRAFLFFIFRMFWWNFTIGYQYPGIWIWSWIFSPSFDWSKTRPIRNELLYFSSFRYSHKTLLLVINAQESESEVRFSLQPSIGYILDRSETSFSIFHFFDALKKHYHRLSMPMNLNPRPDLSSRMKRLAVSGGAERRRRMTRR